MIWLSKPTKKCNSNLSAKFKTLSRWQIKVLLKIKSIEKCKLITVWKKKLSTVVPLSVMRMFVYLCICDYVHIQSCSVKSSVWLNMNQRKQKKFKMSAISMIACNIMDSLIFIAKNVQWQMHQPTRKKHQHHHHTIDSKLSFDLS